MKTRKLLLSLFAVASLGANAQTADIQVIHNSPDAAASTVDVYLGSTLALDDVDFRTASPYTSVPAGVPITVGVAPGNSTTADDTLKAFTYNLTSGESYVIVANGIISTSGYSPAPAFDLDVYPMARQSASMMANTDVLVMHGSTDAPEVKITNVTDPLSTADLVSSASYRDFAGYLELPTADYNIQVRLPDNTTVAEYEAPLSTLTLGGEAITVLASGFLDPSNNSGGPAFGLYAATAAGGPLVALPAVTTPTTSRIQVVHNCAATDAATVDVWVNDAIKLIDDFDFRTSTPFIDVPSGTNLEIDICAASSTDATNPLYTETINLNGGERYVAVASGTIGSGTYTPATAFDIIAFGNARESATTSGNVDVMVFHGSTDAPAVDVNELLVPAGTIVTDITYGENQGYLDLAATNYVLGVAPTGGANIAQFDADLSSFADSAITVFASGFLDASVNNNGPGFGLYVSIPSGGPLVMLPTSSLSIEENEATELLIYPNPVRDNLTVKVDSKVDLNQYEILDITGKVIQSNSQNNLKTINVSSLPSGTYFIRLFNANETVTSKFIKK